MNGSSSTITDAPVRAPRLITVFGASGTEQESVDWDDAFRLGRALADRGFGLVTGGYGGTMEAVSAGAAAAARPVPIIGVTVPAVFPERTGANPFVTEEVETSSLLQRMERMLRDSEAAVALPGSLGTFTEIMIAWNLAYVTRFGETSPRPLVTVGPAWRELCARVGGAAATDLTLVLSVDTAAEVPPLLDELL